MKALNNTKAGFAVGGTFAIFHAVWLLTVLFGWAQGILNYIFRIHLLNNPFAVAAFNLQRAVALLVFTFIVGWFIGWIYAWLWNMMHKTQA